MPVKVFVLSACSGDKAIAPPVAGCAEIDESSRTELVEAHPDASLPAVSLYTGNEHNHVKAAVDRLAEIADVDWRIISAGFGVVRPETDLPVYECTFSDDDSVRERAERMGHDTDAITKAEQTQVVAEELGIRRDIEQVLAAGYDVAFVALGKKYLHAAEPALSSIPNETTAFAFAPKGNRELLGDCLWVPSTNRERDAHGTTWMQVKGRQLRTVAEDLSTDEDLSELRDPSTVRELSLPSSVTE